MTTRRDKRKGWMVDFVHFYSDGRRERVRKRSPVQTRRGAQAWERQMQQRMLDAGPDPEPRRKEVPTFKEFSDEFMETYARVNNKPSDVASKESILRVHLRPELGRCRLDEIGVQRIERLKARLLDSERSRKTVNNVLTVLGKIMSYALETEVIDKRPRIRLLKTPPSKFDFLDFDEYERLVAVLPEEKVWGPAILAAGEAGLRLGEVLGLHQEDVDHGAGVITVRRSLWQGVMVSPKGGRDRKVPMTMRLAAALRRCKHLKGDLVWCDEKGGHFNVDKAEYAIQRACRRAGLRKIGWHVLRHTFCSHLAMLGAAPKAIQDLAGHKSIQTTMRYMHLAPIALVEAIGLLDGPKNLHARGTHVAPREVPDGNMAES